MSVGGSIVNLGDHHLSFVWQIAESYLNVGQKCYQVTAVKDKCITLNLIESRSSFIKTLIKIISYASVILPIIAKIIKEAYRRKYSFEIVNQTPLTPINLKVEEQTHKIDIEKHHSKDSPSKKNMNTQEEELIEKETVKETECVAACEKNKADDLQQFPAGIKVKEQIHKIFIGKHRSKDSSFTEDTDTREEELIESETVKETEGVTACEKNKADDLQQFPTDLKVEEQTNKIVIEKQRSKDSPFAEDIDTPEKAAAFAAEYGNKAANLQILKHIFKGNREPLFLLDEGIKNRDIQSYLDQHFPQFKMLWKQFTTHFSQNGNKLDEAAGEILETIQKGLKEAFSAPSDFATEEISFIMEAKEPIVVRSTGTKEDSKEMSLSGANESVNNVQPHLQQIFPAIGQMIASSFTLKSLGQRQACGHDITILPSIPVLFNVMLHEKEGHSIPTCGVMFTAEAGLYTSGVTQVSAAPGHAQGVVSGSQAFDMFYVHDGFVHAIIREKPVRQAPGKNSQLENRENSKELKSSPALSKEQLQRLVNMGKRIEDYYGCPMDIEWGYDPSIDKFYLFQARPIVKTSLSPSHLDPSKFEDLHEIRKAVVINAGGASVHELNFANTLFVDSPENTVSEYLQHLDNPPAAIVIGKWTSDNSHEASFCREKGIPLIWLPGTQYSKAKAQIKNSTYLVGTQEGMITVLPSDRKAEEFIAEGLRYHVAPKMESDYLFQSDIDALADFEYTLKAQIQHTDHDALNQRIVKTQGWNILDRCLNAFEMAENSEERAYILDRLLFIVKNKLLKNVPDTQRSSFWNKVLYNSKHIWETFQNPKADDLHKKFAMNWLRGALLKTPLDDVLKADSLLILLGEKVERKQMNIIFPKASTEEEIEKHEYLDTFRRCEKLLPKIRTKNLWKMFLNSLMLDQLRELATMFAHLGPNVVETWLNTSFHDTYESIYRASSDKQKVFDALSKELQDDQIQKALTIAKKTKILTSKFAFLAPEFGNPSTFNTLLEQFDQELFKLATTCAKEMQSSKGLSATILSKTFGSLVETMDTCIKGLTGSPHYLNDEKNKAERFSLLLDRYLGLAMLCLEDQMFSHDPALLEQAKELRRYLPKIFRFLKQEMLKDPKASLLATKYFSVLMAALGSGNGAPHRARPYSLEDLFAMLHLSLTTVAASGGLKHGMKTTPALPVFLAKFQNKIKQDIFLGKNRQPTLQSIDYSYPTIRISFNCPMNNHSAQFIVETQVDAKGNILSTVFEGRFFVGLNFMAYGREKELRVLALSSYYTGNMKAPEGFKMQHQGNTIQFKWQVPHNEDFDLFWISGRDHLQRMINYLQNIGSPHSDIKINEAMISENIKFIKDFEDAGIKDKRTFQTGFLKGLLNKLNSKTFAKYFYSLRRLVDVNPSNELLKKVFDRVLDEDTFWDKNQNDFIKLMHFICFMGKDFPFSAHRLNKINARLPTIREFIATTKVSNSSVCSDLNNIKEFLERYDPSTIFPESNLIE